MTFSFWMIPNVVFFCRSFEMNLNSWDHLKWVQSITIPFGCSIYFFPRECVVVWNYMFGLLGLPAFIFINTKKDPNWVICVINYYISILQSSLISPEYPSTCQRQIVFFSRAFKARSGKWRLWIGAEVEATRAGLNVSTWQKVKGVTNE